MADFEEIKRRVKRSIALALGRWRPAVLRLGGNRVQIGKGGRRIKFLAHVFFHRNARENLVVCGSGVKLSNMRVHIHGRGNRLEIGDNVKLSGVISIFGQGVTVRIGDNFDAKGCKLVAWDADVSIGDDCLFAGDIEIRSGDIHRIEDQATGEVLNPAAPITLGNRVWVGSYVSIMKGAAIPDDSVVGTRSIVTRQFISPGVLLAGAPAGVVREGICWRR